MPKAAKSGLGTLKRDFSDAPPPNQQKSSQEIYWSPSPQTQNTAPLPKLSGQAQRLKDIQDALANLPSSKPPAPLTESTIANKRPSPIATSTTAPPQKKARQLPPSWQNDDPLSRSSFGSSSIASNNARSTNNIRDAISKPAQSSAPPSSKKKLSEVFLSTEQKQILELVQRGESVFYTGSAGTGKSVLLRQIIQCLRRVHSKSPDAVAITASTGIAACNIGGVTIHSFAGIGLGVETAEDLVTRIKKNKKSLMRWLRTRVLIIDEVSMMDGDLFDKLAQIGSILRKKKEPFGGIQVIVTGDFFQLPPVTKGSAGVKFAFEASLWKETIKRTFNLTKVFRQSDQEFVDMLNEMRFGRLSQKSIDKFRSLSREVVYDDGLGPTELFPRREDVERSNSTRMTQLKTEQREYISQDGGTITDENQRQKMLANFMAPQRLILRVDSQVMLIKNVDESLVNGSMGRVVRFVDSTIYGSEHDIESISKVGTISGGTTANPSGAVSATKKAQATSMKLYPVVEFLLPSGYKREILVLPESWKVELPSGEIQVSRLQLPLILAWAMSIHKSQGQTLERVKVDLGKVFEKGQAYVALSRATSLAGLQVLNFDASKVMAHPKVAQWSKSLETVSDCAT